MGRIGRQRKTELGTALPLPKVFGGAPPAERDVLQGPPLYSRLFPELFPMVGELLAGFLQRRSKSAVVIAVSLAVATEETCLVERGFLPDHLEFFPLFQGQLENFVELSADLWDWRG